MLPTRFASFGQSVSEETNFRNRPTRNKDCVWWPCLLTYRVEMDNLYRGSFDQAVLEGKIQMWKVNRRRTPSEGKISHGLWPDEFKLKLI